MGPLLGDTDIGRAFTVKLVTAVFAGTAVSVPVTCETPGIAVEGVAALPLIAPVPPAVTVVHAEPAKVRVTVPGAQPLPEIDTVEPASPLDGLMTRLGVTLKDAGFKLALLPARSAAVTV
jgi:hypothetical protein